MMCNFDQGIQIWDIENCKSIDHLPDSGFENLHKILDVRCLDFDDEKIVAGGFTYSKIGGIQIWNRLVIDGKFDEIP